MDLFLTNTLFTSQDIHWLECCGSLVGYCDGTHSQQRIHWGQFNASFNATFVQNCSNEEITHLHLGWPESEYIFIFFGWTIHHSPWNENQLFIFFIEYFSAYYKWFIHAHHYFHTWSVRLKSLLKSPWNQNKQLLQYLLYMIYPCTLLFLLNFVVISINDLFVNIYFFVKYCRVYLKWLIYILFYWLQQCLL